MVYTVAIMPYFAAAESFVDQMVLFGLIAAYTLVGVIIMVISIVLSNYIFKLDIRKELIEDHNVAYGAMLAGLFIAVSIIVAASIVG